MLLPLERFMTSFTTRQKGRASRPHPLPSVDGDNKPAHPRGSTYSAPSNVKGVWDLVESVLNKRIIRRAVLKEFAKKEKVNNLLAQSS